MIYKILERIRGAFENIEKLIDEGKYDEAKKVCGDFHFAITGLVALGKEKAQHTDEKSGFNYEAFAAKQYFGVPDDDMKPTEQQSGGHVKDGYIYWDRVRSDTENSESYRNHSKQVEELDDIMNGKIGCNPAHVTCLVNKMLEDSERQKKELAELIEKAK